MSVESGDRPSKRQPSTGRGFRGEGCTCWDSVSRQVSCALAQITSSTVPLRSLQPACTDSHNPGTKLMTLQHAGLAAPALAYAITTATPQATDSPLLLTNCGKTITLDEAPASAVTTGESGQEK